MLKQKLIIVSIYILLLAGGLWHALGVLQDEMRLLAAPMIVIICLLLCFDCIRAFDNEADAETSGGRGAAGIKRLKQKFFLWGGFVLVASFLLELIGVQTGAIFGAYGYLDVLQPVIWSVPAAIGFAWLGMIISSVVLAQRLIRNQTKSQLLVGLLAAVFMVIFDLFMEPAAVKLSYWQWRENAIPVRNYFVWLVFGGIFSYIGLRFGLFERKMSTVAVHAYVAQLLYFLIVNLSRS